MYAPKMDPALHSMCLYECGRVRAQTKASLAGAMNQTARVRATIPQNASFIQVNGAEVSLLAPVSGDL